MSSNEWLPAQIPFDLVRRGFAPDQVTAHLERLEYDLRIATANGDATNQRLSEVTAQLQAAHHEVDQLRSQLDNLAKEPVSMTGLSNRMQRMIRLAEEEAAEIRARANADAEKVTANAAAMTAATAAERDRFDAERERTRRQLADQVRDMLSEATTEAENTRAAAVAESQARIAAATAEAERLVLTATEESRSTLTAAREEATATLASARNEATATLTAARNEASATLTSARAEATATLTAARAEAEQTVTSAREEADALTAAATAERERLDAEGLARRTAIEEDFEIAISSRRAEAHQRLTEREEISVADAKQRVADATAEAEFRIREATAQAAELVRRAAAESHQRVAEADSAFQQLSSLRGSVLDQLASLRDHLQQVDQLAATAPTLLDPPDGESGRPVAGDFPVDPAERPTDLPKGYGKSRGPWDDVTVESLRAGHRDAQQQGPGQGDIDQGVATGSPAGQETDAGTEDPALQALAEHFDSGSDVPAEVAESDTDTFPRVEGAEDAPVPAQQRKGMRAFAERAIGGR